MKYVTIESVLSKKITGEWGKDPIDSAGTKVIRTTNFTNLGIIDYSKIVSRKIEQKKIEQKKLYSGDVIIEKSGGSPTQPVGRVVFFVNPDDSIYLCNNFTSILRPNLDLVSPKYFFYTLFYNHLSKKTLRYQNKTTGIINLQLERYLKSKIPLPLLDDQIRIATILSRAENLIAKRKESIELLDKLLKSTFLEMFGDPVNNAKGWEKKTAISYSDCIVPGRDKPKSFTGSTPWVTTNDLNNLGFTYKSKNGIGLSKAEINKVRAKIIPKNSVIITCVGALGITTIARENIVVNQQLHTFQCKNSINNIFFMYSISFQISFMYRLATKTTVPYMNKSICNSIPIICPPLKLQNQFETIVIKIESIKSKYKQSLTELENLYGALSQRAFKGELDLSKIPIKKESQSITGSINMTIPSMKMEGQATVQKLFSKQKLLSIIKSRNGNPFNFNELWDDLEKADFIEMPTYDEIKDMVFMMLEDKEPILSQSFDEDKKEIVLKGI